MPSTRHAFAVKYRTPSGEDLYGIFEVTLPSAEDYRQIAMALSGLLRGARWESLSPDLQAIMMAMARCSVLVKQSPEWFGRPLDSLGAEVFVAVSQEAQRFEREFFRVAQGDSQDNEGRLVVEIRPIEGPTSDQVKTVGRTAP